MDYFHCRSCGEFMDEMEAFCLIPEIHRELDNRPIEWLGTLRCICCNSEDLEEAAECEECGELFPASALDENGLCEDCRKEEMDGCRESD